MEEDDKKGGQGSYKTRRTFWSCIYAWSEVSEKFHWRVSGGCVLYLLLSRGLEFFLVFKELMPVSYICTRYLIPRFSHQYSISMEMTKLLMQIDWNKLTMLVSYTVKDLWNFLLTSWANCQQGGNVAPCKCVLSSCSFSIYF